MRNNQKNKGWSQNEDKAISELVQKIGLKNWSKIAQELSKQYGIKNRSGKQCRQRWHNHLNPDVIKKSWSPEEEQIMFQSHKLFGNKWTAIAQKLPGRTDNSIKNHFYSTIRRSLRRMSKLVGSKNSTLQMRQIKPATLSKIFSIAEGSKEIIQSTSEEVKMEEDLAMDCKQVANHLMQFAKWKPTKKENNQSDIAIFKNVLQQMCKINQKYEGLKYEQTKKRKEEMLAKDFDNVVSDYEDYIAEGQDSYYDKKLTKKQNKQKSKIAVQSSIKQQSSIVKKQEDYEPSNKYEEFLSGSCVNLCKGYLEDPVKIQQKCQQLNNLQMEQQIQLQLFPDQSGNKFTLDHGPLSPGFINTPLGLSPNLFQSMLQRSTPDLFSTSFTNQQCNSVLAAIKNQIQRNKQGDMRNYIERVQSGSSLRSSSSAFSQFNQLA